MTSAEKKIPGRCPQSDEKNRNTEVIFQVERKDLLFGRSFEV